MKTRVEFRSQQFPPYEGEEAQINPGMWGKRLAEYFAQRLPEHGIKAGALVAEDWGWYLHVEVQGTALGLCCGHQKGLEAEAHSANGAYFCFTDPSQPITRKWFKSIDVTPALTQLVVAMEAILRADPDIREIVWD